MYYGFMLLVGSMVNKVFNHEVMKDTKREKKNLICLYVISFFGQDNGIDRMDYAVGIGFGRF